MRPYEGYQVGSAVSKTTGDQRVPVCFRFPHPFFPGFRLSSFDDSEPAGLRVR
jgi:hypothetical protein